MNKKDKFNGHKSDLQAFEFNGTQYQVIEPPSKKEVLTILALPSCFGTADEKKKLVIDIIVRRIDVERLFAGVQKELAEKFLALIPVDTKLLDNKRQFPATKVSLLLYELCGVWEAYKAHNVRRLREDVLSPLFEPIEIVVNDAKVVAFDKAQNVTKKLLLKGNRKRAP